MSELNGTFYHNDWWPTKNSTYYTCQFSNLKITQKNITKIRGTHKSFKTNDNVYGVRFDDCQMNFIPTGLTKIFKNMKILLIFNSNIKKLKKEDFAEYSQLTQLWFSTIEIDYLPGNLLELMPNLEIISFQSCKIRYIDSNFFDNHPNLKVAKFNSNINIECWYDTVSGNEGGVTYDELKKVVEKKCQPPLDYETYFKISRKLSYELKNFLMLEDTKDAIVKINENEIKVHKILIQLRSPKMHEMIKNNEELRFDDFKLETFNDFINFLYHDELNDKSDMFELLKIAEKLENLDVKIFAMKNLDKMKMTQDNALKMLECGKELGNRLLQDNAFKKIKKMLPEKKLKDEWVDDVEKLKNILDAKQKMDEEIQKAKEKFDQLFL